jgi:hypothetical protein
MYIFNTKHWSLLRHKGKNSKVKKVNNFNKLKNDGEQLVAKTNSPSKGVPSKWTSRWSSFVDFAINLNCRLWHIHCKWFSLCDMWFFESLQWTNLRAFQWHYNENYIKQNFNLKCFFSWTLFPSQRKANFCPQKKVDLKCPIFFKW